MNLSLRRAIGLGLLASFALTLAVPAWASEDDALQNRQQMQLQRQVKGEDHEAPKVRTQNQFRLQSGPDGPETLSSTTAEGDQDPALKRPRDRAGFPEAFEGLVQRLMWAWERIRR